MSNYSGNLSGTTPGAANYGARMGSSDASNPEPQAIVRQDNMQHASTAGVDPMALRRALLVSGMAGQAARAGK